MLAKSTTAKRAPSPPSKHEPQNHRTVDRVTQILEQVVYKPGMTFAELARALDTPKSSVYGFLRGPLANGWLDEDGRRFYLGPAVYGLTLASGPIRAGLVTHEDLEALHQKTGTAVFLGVQAGDHLNLRLGGRQRRRRGLRGTVQHPPPVARNGWREGASRRAARRRARGLSTPGLPGLVATARAWARHLRPLQRRYDHADGRRALRGTRGPRLAARALPRRGTACQRLPRGDVDVMVGDLASLLPHVQGGCDVLLGVTAPQRVAVAPDAPS